MGKLKKLFATLIVLLLIAGVLAYSALQIHVTVGKTTMDSKISPPTFFGGKYTGTVIIKTPLSISNGGLIVLSNLKVDIIATFTSGVVSNVTVGNGNNDLGNINPFSSHNYTIVVNATKNIGHLAVESGTIHVYITVKVLVYGIPQTINKLVNVNWKAPYQP